MIPIISVLFYSLIRALAIFALESKFSTFLSMASKHFVLLSQGNWPDFMMTFGYDI